MPVGCFNPDNATEDTDGSSGDSGATTATAEPTTAADDTTTDQADSTGADDVDGCVQDSDCDDGLACNGTEICDDGTCSPGAGPCTNPDAEHCDISCEESAEGANCGVVAADDDGDEHGDMACAAAPGDDCNDDEATVFTGAEEICDGLDNDCNGLADLEDGLGLYGTPVIVPDVFFAELAYSPAEENYAIAYNGPTGPQFVSYNLDQTLRATPRSFPPDLGPGDRVFLEAAGTGYAGIYRDDADGDFIRQRQVNADGDIAIGGVVSSSGGVGFFYSASELDGGGLGVIWNQDNTQETRLRLLGDDLAPLGQVLSLPFQGNTPRISRNGDTFAIGTREESTWMRFYDNDLVEQAAVEVTSSPTGTIYGTFGVGPMGTGFGVAFNGGVASQRVEYVEYEADGTERCGPIVLADSSQSSFLNMDTDGSTAVIYASVGDDWTLYRVGENCELVDEGVMIESVTFFGEIGDVDINESGIGIVSQIFDDGGANPRYSFRALGPNLCDAPIGA